MSKNSWEIHLNEETAHVDEAHIQKVCECRRRVFSTEEDKLLAELVQSQQCTNWMQIAQKMPNRTARQCRDRWLNYLCPSNSFAPWTKEEDQLIIEKVNELGTRWSAIAKFIEGRSDNTIKNRWYSGLKKNCYIDSNGKYVLKSAGQPKPKGDRHKRVFHPANASLNEKKKKKKVTKPKQAPKPAKQEQPKLFLPSLPLLNSSIGTLNNPIVIPTNPFLTETSMDPENGLLFPIFPQLEPPLLTITQQLQAQGQFNIESLNPQPTFENDAQENDFWDRHLTNQVNEMNQDPFNTPEVYGEWF